MKNNKRCPDCNVEIGKTHENGCDIEACPECGMQRLSCGCTETTMPKIPWDGDWPHTATCIKLGFWTRFGSGKNGESRGWVPCDDSDSQAVPDYVRLMKECVWDKNLGEFVPKNK